MSKQYFVIVKGDCPHCNGGIITRPVYNVHTERYERTEFDCPACGGTGEGEQRVSLADALEDLLQPGSDMLEFVARMLAEQAKVKVIS